MNNLSKLSKDQMRVFVCALQNECFEEIENVRDKYWNPDTVTLTCGFNKTGLHHGHFAA